MFFFLLSFFTAAETLSYCGFGFKILLVAEEIILELVTVHCILRMVNDKVRLVSLGQNLYQPGKNCYQATFGIVRINFYCS